MKKKSIIAIILIIVLAITTIFVTTQIRENQFKDQNSERKSYTWEEFEKLPADQQIAFQNSFKNSDEFEKWMDNVKYENIEKPWEDAGKKIEEYTWEEFEKLSAEQQIVFQNTFKNSDEFEKWIKKVTKE